MTAALELRDVVKRYDGTAALDGLSLAVPVGASFGLLGPNGAGKTTAIRIAMDIVAADAGEVRLFGLPSTRAALARIGYLPEERGLYRRMRVVEHLVFLGELRGLRRRAARAAASRWLERLGLGERAASRVEELSKGMQQKVQLAATLLCDPDVLILDEPFSGLDPLNQGLFRGILEEHRARGGTLLLSTHVMEHAERLCDAVCLLARGRVVLAGELAALKRRFGGRTWRVAGRGDLRRAAALPEVERCLPDEGGARLVLREGADPAQVLRELVAAAEVLEFRAEEPDLEAIFVRAVADGS